MSERDILSLKPDLRLEWQGQDGHDETQEPDHSASLGDSGAPSTRIKFSVHTGVIRVTLTVGPSLPVYPDEQTFSVSAGMSRTCQELTSVLWHRRATRYPIPSRPFASKQSIEPKGVAHAKNVGRSVVI
jgi:hypothetical protein